MIKVTLLSGPQDLQRTLNIIWQTSKTTDSINMHPPDRPSLLLSLLNENVPVLRHFYFTFLLEDMTISFREQLVRSQYDHYWIQSGRITDWTRLRMDYPACTNDDEGLMGLARHAEASIKLFIESANAAKYPPEDYRDLVPLGALHRGIWTANLESLNTRFKKRTCWISQNTKWFPVLSQVARELRSYDSTLEGMAGPPCSDRDGNWIGCPFNATMEDRLNGTDPLPICPRWAKFQIQDIITAESLVNINQKRVKLYEEMWGYELLDG